MDFNLKQYEAADTATLTILDAAGDEPLRGVDGEPVVFELYGPGTEQFANGQDKIDRAREARTMQAAMRGGKVKGDGAAEQRKLVAEKWAGCTKSISPNFPVSPIAVHTNPKLGYITRQVANFVEDWGNFLPQSAKTSATTSGSTPG